MEYLRLFSHWVAGYADSPWALLILVLNSFTESIFNPIPPDPLLVGMSILHPHLALLYAAAVTAASVLGALVGHWLGLKFGRPLVLRFFAERKVDRVERLFQTYGTWIVLVAAFTPVPYKVFAVMAGVMELDRKAFILASIIGRGARFFLLGVLLFLFGEAVQGFIETRFEILTILFGGILVSALALGFAFLRWRRPRSQRESPKLVPEQVTEADEPPRSGEGPAP